HDYFAICPQVNLLPWLHGAYCGEPDIGGCNACIADRPSYCARGIVSWRRTNAWQFLEAGRRVCPSGAARKRLARYGLDQRAMVAPHEPAAAEDWVMSPPPISKREALRVAVIGVLAYQKGALAVINVALTADPAALSIHLIGYAERALVPAMPQGIVMTG